MDIEYNSRFRVDMAEDRSQASEVGSLVPSDSDLRQGLDAPKTVHVVGPQQEQKGRWKKHKDKRKQGEERSADAEVEKRDGRRLEEEADHALVDELFADVPASLHD